VAATTWAARFARLDTALVERLSGGVAPVPPEVREAWRVLHGRGGRCRVEDVAAHVGWSRRHLSERFRVATGLTPTQAARIARFEATRRLLTHPRRPPLAEVAVRCGYADQPHLAREWRALTGCSVGTRLRVELPFLQDSGPVEEAPSSA
jgi:transcriptional regulator GlxA family with amidase domain